MENGKVWVKLKDKGSIFHDASQPNGTVTGEHVRQLQNNKKVGQALRNSVLVEVKPEEVPANIKAAYELMSKNKDIVDIEAAIVAVAKAAEEASAAGDATAAKEAADKAEKEEKARKAKIAQYAKRKVEELKAALDKLSVKYEDNADAETLATALVDAEAVKA